ncbi:MAG: hypothetical protein K9L64_01225 [Candidatus Izimaplasma sp.]|nr:hypothetical protein [Candidatus Izimaplasma bacterium]
MYKIEKNELFTIIHVELEGIKISFSDYGASIYALQTKDVFGKYEDIILQYKNIKDNIKNSIYLNATIGPIAGRIKNGVIKTKDKTYNLDKNFANKHTLHSGQLALSYKTFDFKILESSNYIDVLFTYHEESLINYFISVKYRVTKNQVQIKYTIETENNFVFNITNHAYFNLSGNLKNNIKNHMVKLNTKKRHLLNNDLISKNKIVEEDIFDFSDFKPIHNTLNKLENNPIGGIDDIFFFPNHNTSTPMAIVYDPISKRMMEVYSSYDHLVFYTHNNTDNKPLKHLDNHPRHYALCFECEKSPCGFTFPDASNPELTKAKKYSEFIIFKFGIYNN